MPDTDRASVTNYEAATMPAASPQKTIGFPPFSRRKWLQLFMNGDYGKLCDEFLRIFEHFVSCDYRGVAGDRKAYINDFVENFLFFFCQPEFRIPDRYLKTFIRLHPLIATIVALSDFTTATPWVIRVAQQKENFYKLLVLYNARCGIAIDPKQFFAVNSLVASEWWNLYWLSTPAFCLREIHERIKAHSANLDDRFSLFGANTLASYFPVTYVAPECERAVKQRLNSLIAATLPNATIRNKPNRRKIALVTDRWHPSAVYTSLSPFIRSLKGHYDITLIHYGNDKNIQDPDFFERLMRINVIDRKIDLEPLQDNEFSAAIFPDIGMNPESIILSTIRIAPVQVVLYGHPASTWSPAIDYFIGGRMVEDLDNAYRNYGEQLVVIPGLGASPVFPENFAPPAAEFPNPKEPLVINCAWSAQKVSYPLLAALREIIAKARKPAVFRIFPGGSRMQFNGFIPFVKDIQTMLGKERVEIVPDMPPRDYLANICKGRFSIDSYPFGGFNTVIDALHCKKPVVVWQGDRAYNRFGAATLEITGMPELIARTESDYISTVVRMIDDDRFRERMVARVAAVDLKAEFAKYGNPDDFRKAIDHLIDNHDRLKAENQRQPIIIE